METMEISLINKLLKDVLYNQQILTTFVETKEGHQGVNNYDGAQGEYNEYFKIYKIKEKPELFIKVTYNTDSYGSNDSIVNINFVKAKPKTVTIYEIE